MPGAYVRPALLLHDATGHRIVRHVSRVNAFNLNWVLAQIGRNTRGDGIMRGKVQKWGAAHGCARHKDSEEI